MKDNKPQNEITVGMGATYSINGDAYPHTVVNVISQRCVEITDDSYKVTEKNAYLKEGAVECEFTTNWDAPRTTITKRKNGRWFPKGQPMTWYGGYSVGSRYYSRNPHI